MSAVHTSSIHTSPTHTTATRTSSSRTSAIRIRSSALATAFGVALLGGVLAGSTLTVPDEAGRKGDLRVVASDCQGCANAGERLAHFETDVVVDRDAGLITLVRDRVGG